MSQDRLNELQKRKRRRRLIRQCSRVVMIVWAFLGLVGLIATAQWMIEALTGRQPHVFGSGIVQAENTEGVADVKNQTKPPENMDDTGNLYGRYHFSEEERQEIRRMLADDPKLLVLVNKENELDIDFDPQLRSICNGRLMASAWMYEDLAAMLKAASDAGFDYWIASAHRSRQRQQELIDEDVTAFMQQGMDYDEALARTLEETMPAGYSEHETGLALDILCSGNTQMDASQADEPGNRWLVEHCAQYGFILRYPADAENITEINYEPWHFRYVGQEAAAFMMERGLTLEEFVAAVSVPS